MGNITFRDTAKSNIRKSILLLGTMVILLSAVITAIGLYLGYNPGFILLIALAFSLISTAMSYWNADSIVLLMTRAKIIMPEDNPMLHNIVEEMSIAAGIPIPRIAIVEDNAPNAFATGRDEAHALIAFTTGILSKMNREELQAVTAHELSHIKNRDTLVSAVAAVTAGMIAIVVDITWRISFGSSRSKNQNPILLIAAVASIILAPIAAILIQAAISRKRESLADATAVAFTRNPAGLRQALEVLRDDSTVVSTKSNAVAHLWIESPLKQNKMSKLFDTHPPIQQRIDLLKKMEQG